MNKKIFLIWGWVDSSNYIDYENYLLNEEFNPYEEKIFGWKDNLQDDLWEWYEVIRIPMPNKFFAEYKYWKIVFEKALVYFGNENILIWHSLWWSFLLKYLNENNLENISQIHLLAPWVFDSEKELIWSFNFDKQLSGFKKYENITKIYFSRDDEVVSFSDWEYLQKILKNSKFEIFEDLWHFIFLEHFEKLIDNIRK